MYVCVCYLKAASCRTHCSTPSQSGFVPLRPKQKHSILSDLLYSSCGLLCLPQIPGLKLELLTFDLGGRAPSVQALKSYDTGEEQVGNALRSLKQSVNSLKQSVNGAVAQYYMSATRVAFNLCEG